jgi:O-antigen/teichoic acid export membrane protein
MSDTAAGTAGIGATQSGDHGRRVRRSVIYSLLDKYLVQILQIVTTAIMARLLTPAETGLFMVAQAVILLADNFRIFGVGVYIVQEPDLRPEMIRTAFTVTLIVSLAIGGFIFLGAGGIASLYDTPALSGLLMVAALNFLFLPLASPNIALMQRELAFNALAAINVAAALTNAIVTILLGFAGFGAVSFAWGFVASGIVTAALAIALRPAFWIFRPTLQGARRVLTFGGVSTLVTVINLGYDLLPRLALGKILGFDAVGLYGRALTVCQLPERAVISALQPVVLPAMAHRARAGGDLKEGYLRGHMFVSAVQWPCLIMLALLAEPVVRILLGAQWGEVPALVRVMAPAMMALAPAFMTYPLLVAAGRIRDTLLASLVSLPPSVALVVFAAHHGLEAVALSLILSAPFQMFVALWFIRRATGLTWAEVWHASRLSLGVAFATALLPVLLIALSPTGFDLGWIQTILAIAGGALGWYVAVQALAHPVGAEIVRMASAMLRR